MHRSRLWAGHALWVLQIFPTKRKEERKYNTAMSDKEKEKTTLIEGNLVPSLSVYAPDFCQHRGWL